MKKILISSFDMEVGGVERSLISMLNNFDYDSYEVDLFLHSHSGDFLNLLPASVNLLKEVEEYKTVRLSIKDIFSQGMFKIALARLFAKVKAKLSRSNEPEYIQAQFIWKYCLPFFPRINKKYDMAISYLWPHDFVANKVEAEQKIAWIHTDYSTIDTNTNIDLKSWNAFHHIISISEGCSTAFLKKYPSLKNKVSIIENITSPAFIKKMAQDPQYTVPYKKTDFNLLSVGRICYPKAFDKAVKVLDILHKKGLTDIKWYIVGYGPDEQKLQELIVDLNLEKSFILLGKKNNPYPYIDQCDLYVQPSRYEGKSVSVTEAKILAKPIMVTNYPTAMSQVTHNKDAIVCDLEIEDIASSLIYMYENQEKRKQLASYCKQKDYNNTEELQKLYYLINMNKTK